MKRWQTTISIFVLSALMLTGCSTTSRSSGNVNQTPSNLSGAQGTNNVSSPPTTNQTIPSGTSSSSQVAFQSDLQSVIDGIAGSSAQMLPTVHATVIGQQYGMGMKAVVFVSPSTGYLAGQGIILKTTNGGQVFQPVFRGNVDVSGLSVLRGNAKMIVAWGKDKVLMSSDAGLTWHTQTLPVTSGTVQQVELATASEGFAIVGDGYNTGGLWRTTDGGTHWQRLTTPSQSLSSVSFGTANVGWLGAEDGNIYETSDGGNNWTRVFHPNVQYPGRPQVHAVSAQSCWAMIVGQSGMSQTSYSVFRTKDGVHWTPVLGVSTAGAGPAPDNATHAPKGPGMAPGPMVVLNSDQAVVTGVCRACGMGSVQVSATQTGGSTWTTYPTIQNGMGPAISMSFVSLDDGWILESTYSSGTFLLHTADGGAHWAEVYPMVRPHPVGGLSFLNANVGYGLGVVGDANVVVKTTDGGQSWGPVGSLPVKTTGQQVMGDMVPIYFVSESRGYALGSDGNVYETRDGGRTWRESNLLLHKDPFALLTFLDNGQIGMATTYNSEAEVTVDGGSTWHRVELAANSSGNAQAGVYLAGLAKIPLASTLKTMVGAETPGWLGMRDGHMAWMPAQNGRGYFITTNGGAKWQNVDFGPQYAQASALDFVNQADGWMITLSGALLRTTNGGQTWFHAAHPHS